jgi:hypothetical protein
MAAKKKASGSKSPRRKATNRKKVQNRIADFKAVVLDAVSKPKKYRLPAGGEIRPLETWIEKQLKKHGLDQHPTATFFKLKAMVVLLKRESWL